MFLEFSQPPVCQEDQVPTHQLQGTACSLEESEPPAIKEEPEDPSCYQDGEQLIVKEESAVSLVTPIHEEHKPSEDPILDMKPDQANEKSEVSTTGDTSVSPEPDCDLQLPSNSPHVAESKDQENYNAEDSGSTPGEALKPTAKQNKSKRRSGNAKKPADSAVDWNTDTDATSATCHTGEKQVKATSDMTGHSPVHANDKPDANSACGKGSRGRRLLSAHKKSRRKTGPFTCETCGKEFRLSAYLRRHMTIHKGEKAFSCETCGNNFQYPSRLKVHMRVHTGERPYVCKVCGKTFIKSSALSVHMKIHTGERPYACKVCGKTFIQNSTLRVHMRIHTGERPFSCKSCGKNFQQSSSLSRHMMIHTLNHVRKPSGKLVSR